MLHQTFDVSLLSLSSEMMLLQYEGIQQHPHGPELFYKWTLVEKMMMEQREGKNSLHSEFDSAPQ